MKHILSLIFLLTGLKALALPSNEEGQILYGRWKFNSFIYRDEEHPLLNPNLNLFFEFNRTGSSRLWWYRSNEDGFCERTGFFSYENNFFTDEVVWVNPHNSIECGKDPDMQLGRKSTTKYNITDEKMYMYLSLGGEDFVYIFKRIGKKQMQNETLRASHQ